MSHRTDTQQAFESALMHAAEVFSGEDQTLVDLISCEDWEAWDASAEIAIVQGRLPLPEGPKSDR